MVFFNSSKGSSTRFVERIAWMSLTAVLLLTIVVLLFFAFPNVFHAPYSYVAPSAHKDKPSAYAHRLERIYSLIMQHYVQPVDADDLYQAASQGMLNLLENPYTEVMQASSAMNVQDTLAGEFGGVGLVISKKPYSSTPAEPKSERVYVVYPIEGTPAYHAGIRAGDYISKIDGRSTQNMSIDDVMGLMRGKPGTTVTLTIQREEAELDIALKRSKIEIQVAKQTLLGDYGYLKMMEFTQRLPIRVQEILQAFNKQNIKGLIIDLRGNPGGTLDAALKVADFFLNEGDVIVITSSGNKKENVTYTSKHKPLLDSSVPIVLLIDKGSASASEILAGALHAHHRATVIGQTSYGKAQVQQIFPLKQDNSELLKLTVAYYLTPDGKNIDKEGISPDIPITEIDTKPNAAKNWKKLHDSEVIKRFLDQHIAPTRAQIEALQKEQKQLGIELSINELLYLIRMERSLRLTPPPVCDLPYDPILEKAMQVLTQKSV